jgi:hypothetical protein
MGAGEHRAWSMEHGAGETSPGLVVQASCEQLDLKRPVVNTDEAAHNRASCGGVLRAFDAASSVPSCQQLHAPRIGNASGRALRTISRTRKAARECSPKWTSLSSLSRFCRADPPRCLSPCPLPMSTARSTAPPPVLWPARPPSAGRGRDCRGRDLWADCWSDHLVITGPGPPGCLPPS